MSPAPRAAAIYCRISKDLNGSRLGVDRQRELCEKLAAEKGWKVGQVYVDNDVSAYAGAPRPEFERMLTDLEAGTADAVLVVDQDRLTRHPMELESFIILADGLGIPIANVSGEIDLSTSDGRFRARILGAVARQESEKKSERIRRQKDQAASKGWAHGGRRRYGFTHARAPEGHATLVVVPAEAKRIQEAAARVLAGESLRSIAVNWNQEGVPTATGAQWRVTTLRTMLTGPHVAGLRVHQGEIVGEGAWPAILDRATWEQVRVVLGDPRRRLGGRPAVYMLSGILECSECGGRLHHSIRADSGAGRYACAPAGGLDACGKIAISAEPAERIVAEAVLEALSTPAHLQAMAEAPVDVDGVARQIEQAEAALEQLAADHYSEGVLSRREYMAARTALDARMTELRSELPTTRQTVALPSDGEALRTLWDAATTTERRQIVLEVVEKAVVGPGTRGKRTVDPDRISLVWRV
jgi:DNA invertase Pin-like site-specific DNA recombinase